MDRQTVLTGLAVMFIAASVAFTAGLQLFGVEDRELYSSQMNVTVDTDNRVETLSFDNKTMDIMFEPEMLSTFLDLNQDGTDDIEVELSEGEHIGSQVVSFGPESYRIYFRYTVGGADESFLTVYRVRQL